MRVRALQFTQGHIQCYKLYIYYWPIGKSTAKGYNEVALGQTLFFSCLNIISKFKRIFKYRLI